MTQKEHKDLKVDIQLNGIELIKSSINYPVTPIQEVRNFNFKLGIESRSDNVNKLIIILVNILIQNDDQSVILGELSVSYIFKITNFDDVVKVGTDGKMSITQHLNLMLNSIAISTTRGVMFSTFKGTFLHDAILPIVDPSQIQESNLK